MKSFNIYNMNNQKHLNMKEEKEKENEVTHIELAYNDLNELEELATNEIFIQFILKKTFQRIEYAIDNNLDKVEIFNIFNMSLVVELKRKNYKTVLERVIEPYVKAEDYETCSKIKNLINKL